jgi:hypothetical protein
VGMNASDLTLRGPHARAIAAAYAEFANTGFDVARYQVIVRTGGQTIEVAFVPDQTPGHSVRGGRTEAGREIHYRVSRDEARVLRTSYAR